MNKKIYISATLSLIVLGCSILTKTDGTGPKDSAKPEMIIDVKKLKDQYFKKLATEILTADTRKENVTLSINGVQKSLNLFDIVKTKLIPMPNVYLANLIFNNFDKYNMIHISQKGLGIIADAKNNKVVALMNAANPQLQLGSGIAAAVNKAGGPAVQSECNKIITALNKLGVKDTGKGGSALTTSGNMTKDGIMFVLHASAISASGTADASAEAVFSATFNSLLIATIYNLTYGTPKITKIEMPFLGGSVGGLKIKDCSRAMMLAIATFYESLPNIQANGKTATKADMIDCYFVDLDQGKLNDALAVYNSLTKKK